MGRQCSGARIKMVSPEAHPVYSLFLLLLLLLSLFFVVPTISKRTGSWESTSAPRSTSSGWSSFCSDLIDACVVLRGNKTLVSNYSVESEGFH